MGTKEATLTLKGGPCLAKRDDLMGTERKPCQAGNTLSHAVPTQRPQGTHEEWLGF